VKRTDKGDPELSPVFQLHKVFSTKEEQADVAEGCRTAGIGCIDCKKVLIRNVFAVLEPIWAKRKTLLNDPDQLRGIVEKGNDKARRVAQETMQLVRKAMGLY